ncbi:MAG: PAS domain S-box protein [Desulfovibrionaceae bacterium]|nr:PAS domain S-box protein [Desulfovibrionaceae bacterium]MBF0512871.1 PAS domain S-box protein [Desulfovibrionaceae bacterium]
MTDEGILAIARAELDQAIRESDWERAARAADSLHRACLDRAGLEHPADAAVRVVREAFFAQKPSAEPPGSLSGNRELAKVLEDVLAVRDSLMAMANGDLSKTIAVKGFLGGSLKMLQAHLNHLTWQTKMVAKGDFSQRVDFMGEFAEAFNDMVAQLDEARKKITESEERYRSFFTSVEAIKLIVDPATGAVMDANPAAMEFYGYDREQLRGMSIRDLDTEPARESLAELANIAANKKGHGFFRHRLASGELREIEVYASLIQFKGISLVMYSIHDVTELRRLEQIRQDVERIVRHDLKSPLTGLINIPQMLMDDANLTAQQREMLALVAASGQKMLRQINSALELHKIESGTYRLVAQECDPAELIRENVRLMSVSMGVDPGLISIREHGTAGPGCRIPLKTDLLLLDIVLMNLLRNALEASEPGARVGVDIFEDGPEVVISVSNGQPVPAEVRDRFFEKYATAGKKGGTGLGTYSAAIMTRALGGSIAMETADETGTKVTVRIPATH